MDFSTSRIVLEGQLLMVQCASFFQYSMYTYVKYDNSNS
jgi:hypothetical protein